MFAFIYLSKINQELDSNYLGGYLYRDSSKQVISLWTASSVRLLVIPILYEDAPNYIRNEPQRAQRTQRKKEKKEGSQDNLAQPHKEMVLQ